MKKIILNSNDIINDTYVSNEDTHVNLFASLRQCCCAREVHHQETPTNEGVIKVSTWEWDKAGIGENTIKEYMYGDNTLAMKHVGVNGVF